MFLLKSIKRFRLYIRSCIVFWFTYFFILYKKSIFVGIPTDLSKAFNYTPRDLLTDKLSDFGSFGLYIGLRKENMKKNTTIGSPSSDLRNILFYISKWSSFSSVSFVIFSFDLPYTCSDLDNAIYADDTIPYEFRQNSTGTIGYLEPTINKIFAWLKHNRLLAELCYAFMLKFD